MDTGKNVILYCGRGSQRDWIYALLIDKTTGEIFAKRDMISLQGYFDSHKGIKGIAFYNFDMYVSIFSLLQLIKRLLKLFTHTLLPEFVLQNRYFHDI